MTAIGETSDLGENEARIDYRGLPCDILIRRIGFRGDRAALNEFHNHRPLFRLNGGPPLLLIEFAEAVLLDNTSARGAGSPTAVGDRAYDLVIDRFSHLPPGSQDPGPDDLEHTGPNCRRQFRMIAKAVGTWRGHHPRSGPQEVELTTARIAQRHVARHCWWSWLEACRSHRRAWSRFTWRLPNGSVTVRMPRRIAGPERRIWLESNVPAPDPARPAETQRVQTIIDASFGVAEFVPFDELSHSVSAGRGGSQTVLDLLIEGEIGQHGLAAFVAEEKSRRINERKPAIRALGRQGVKSLIRRSFDALEDDRVKDETIAKEFGLSKSSHSRFAGSRWGPESDGPIPELWRNVARVVALLPGFREAAIATGLWDTIEPFSRQPNT